MGSRARARLGATPKVPGLGVSNGVWQIDGLGVNPATISLAPATSSALIVGAFGSLDCSAPTWAGGSGMTQLQTLTYLNNQWPGMGLNLHAQTGIVGGSAVVSVTKVLAIQEFSLIAVEVPNGTVIQASSIVARANPGLGVAITSNPVTTTGPAMLVSFWTGNNFGATVTFLGNPGAGWTNLQALNFLGGYVQAQAAVRYAPTPGTYTCDWTSIEDQGGIISLVAVQ